MAKRSPGLADQPGKRLPSRSHFFWHHERRIGGVDDDLLRLSGGVLFEFERGSSPVLYVAPRSAPGAQLARARSRKDQSQFAPGERHGPPRAWRVVLAGELPQERSFEHAR